MSKHRNENANPRTAAEVEIELADALADRKELGRRIRVLRDELEAARAAERVAAEVDLAARFRAAAGDPAALARLVAEVAESAETVDSGAAPPAPEDTDDGGDADQREPHHEQRGWGGEHG